MGIRNRKPTTRLKKAIQRKSPKSWIRRKFGLLLLIGAGAAAVGFLRNPSKRNQLKQQVEKVKENFGGSNGQTDEQAPLAHTGGAAS